eukprot:COSAG05_NODE_2227_length_3364_cov_6.223583_1_plen_373_part_10
MIEPRRIATIDSDRGSQKPVRSVAWTPDSRRLATGAADNTVRVLDVREPFERVLELLACARSTNDWHRLAVDLAKYVSQNLDRSLLERQLSTCSITQNRVQTATRWTFFHELASCDEDIRRQIWSTLKTHCAPNVYTPLRDGDDKTALDIAIEQRDASAVEFFCKSLDPNTNLHSAAYVTASMARLATEMPQQIVKVLQLLDKSKAIWRDQTEISHLAKPKPLHDGQLLRGSETGEATVWSDDGVESDKPGENKFETKCVLRLLTLRDIAGGKCYQDDIKKSPYHMLITECLEKCPEQHQQKLFTSKTIKVLTDFKWQAFAERKSQWRLLYYSVHFILSGAALLFRTSNDDTGTTSNDGTDSIGTSVLFACMI